jgi:hypothetical protein
MATAVLSIFTIAVAGVTPTYTNATATDGFEFSNNTGNEFVRILNTNGAARTATPATSGRSPSGLALTPVPVTIDATTGDEWLGPFPTSEYGTTVTIAISASAGVSAAAIRLPRA